MTNPTHGYAQKYWRIVESLTMKFTKCFLLLVFACLCINSVSANPAAVELIKNKCADCHMPNTPMPWYIKIPGVKALIENDVQGGLDSFDLDWEILHKISGGEEISKSTLSKLKSVVENNRMPPIQYKVVHWDKVITAEDKQTILTWIQEQSGELIAPLPESAGLDPAKVELGNKLFHDKRLSRDNTISCASCHDLSKGGTDQTQFSTGIGGALGHMNSPTVYNAKFNTKQFWDGRAEDLEAQAHGPVHNPIEMGSSWQEVTHKLSHDRDLVDEFKQVYGIKSHRDITGDMIANAIATFEESLVTSDSRFDKFLRGDNSTLSHQEKQGYKLFQKYNCNNCHAGVALGGMGFEKMGIHKNYFLDRAAGSNGLTKLSQAKEDNGRYNVTKRERDRYRFKIPILRKVSETYPYMHDGNVATLEEAVRIMGEYQVGKKLSKQEVSLIVEFLKTL